MRISNIKEFKKTQYRFVLLMIIASMYAIIFDGQITPQTNNNDGINIGYLIIISILANIIFFCMIFIAMFADVIYRNVRHYHTFERIKSYCAIMAVVSFFITLYSSIKLYPEFRDDYIYFHVIILSIFGIIVPLLWMFINNFTKKFGKSSVN